MAQSWKLTVRRGSQVERRRYGTLEEALDALDRELGGGEAAVRRDAARVFRREVAPAAQVAMRAEVAGPQRFFASVNGGVDVRGDGSPVAFTGRVSRRVVEPRDAEDPVAALRRALAG